MRLGRIHVAFFLAFLLPVEAYAQQVGNRLVYLKIDLASNTYWLENRDGTALRDHGKQQAGSLTQLNDLFLDKGNIVKVIVVKGNPLTTQYSSTKSKPTDTADYTAVKSFGTTLSTLVSGLASVESSTNASLNLTKSNLRMSQFIIGVPAVALANKPPQALQDILNKYDFGDADTQQQFFSDLDDDISTLKKQTSEMPDLFAQAKQSQSVVRAAVCGQDPACPWGLKSVEKDLTTKFATLSSVKADVDKTGDASLLQVDVLSTQDKTMAQLGVLKTFASNVAKIDQDVLLTDYASYSPTQDVKITLTVTDIGLDGKPSGKDAAKNFDFGFHPNSPVAYGVGGALVYSLVKQHTFTASKSGSGLAIADTAASNDHVGQQIGGMLTISPTRWVGTPLTPIFETGVSPIKNKFGIFAGVGFSPYGAFQLGFGVAYQQVDELDAGQKIGDSVTSQDDIKTHPVFHAGFYLHITVAKTVSGSGSQ